MIYSCTCRSLNPVLIFYKNCLLTKPHLQTLPLPVHNSTYTDHLGGSKSYVELLRGRRELGMRLD